jgi:hypothetical protein
MARGAEVLEPDPAMRVKYRTLYKRWLKTYQHLLGR